MLARFSPPGGIAMAKDNNDAAGSVPLPLLDTQPVNSAETATFALG